MSVLDMGPMQDALTGLWKVWREYEKQLQALRAEMEALKARVEALEKRQSTE